MEEESTTIPHVHVPISTHITTRSRAALFQSILQKLRDRFDGLSPDMRKVKAKGFNLRPEQDEMVRQALESASRKRPL